MTGAHSGMGAAAARTLVELGAEVHALDVKPIEAPVKQALVCDLSKRESIDAAVRKLPASVDRALQLRRPARARRSRTSTPPS